MAALLSGHTEADAPLVRALTRQEIDGVRRVGDGCGDVLLACCWLLFMMGDVADSALVWEAKELNFDTHSYIDSVFLIPRGVRATAEFAQAQGLDGLAAWMDNDWIGDPEEGAARWREASFFYQAFGPQIVEAAVATGTFVAPFSMSRMTWIKPSFLWMMYRSGWASKPGQERVVAVRITREGFEPGTHHDADAWRAELDATDARVQWDPERTMTGTPLPHRSLQVGLSGHLVTRYVGEWITAIDDITDRLPAIRAGQAPLPSERPYPLPEEIAARIAAERRR